MQCVFCSLVPAHCATQLEKFSPTWSVFTFSPIMFCVHPFSSNSIFEKSFHQGYIQRTAQVLDHFPFSPPAYHSRQEHALTTSFGPVIGWFPPALVVHPLPNKFPCLALAAISDLKSFSASSQRCMCWSSSQRSQSRQLKNKRRQEVGVCAAVVISLLFASPPSVFHHALIFLLAHSITSLPRRLRTAHCFTFLIFVSCCQLSAFLRVRYQHIPGTVRLFLLYPGFQPRQSTP